MFIRFKAPVLALMYCLVVSPAYAELDPLNSSLILSGGISKAKNACASPWLSGLDPGGTCSENHTALRLAYGYQFTPTWGFEASYGDLGNATGDGTWASYGTHATWSIKAIGWSFAGTGTVPLSSRFSMFGKLGTVRTEFSENLLTTSTTGQSMQGVSINGAPMSKQIKNALTYGVGLQYEITRTFAVRAQYENFGTYDIYGAYGVSAPRIGLSLMSAGAVLKF